MTHHIVQDDIKHIIENLRPQMRLLKGKTVLITGSAGLIGSYFTAVFNELNRSVLKKPCRLLTIDNHIIGNKKNILNDQPSKHTTFLKHDICKPLHIKGPVDYIIHAAGIASPFYYTKFPIETIMVSTIGTQNMLELAKEKKTKGIIFFSSSEIYGDPTAENIPTKETYRGNVSPIGPRSCYDESKRLGETLCITYHRLFNIPIKIIRPFNVYGPGMKPDDRRVFSTFLTYALENKVLPIHGNGLQTRTYSYISDAIIGFFNVLFKGTAGEVYNIGNDKNEINLLNLAKVISRVFKGNLKIKKIPYPKTYPGDEATRRCPDITKANKEFGFTSKVGLEEGISRTLEWYRNAFYSNKPSKNE